MANEIVENASKHLPRSLSCSAPALTAATATLTGCLHREPDPSKVCLSKKSQESLARQAHDPNLQLPSALYSRLPSDLSAEESGHFTDLTFLSRDPVCCMTPAWLPEISSSRGCSFFLRLHGYLLRPDELPRNTPGKEVTSAGVPPFLPFFLRHANNDHSSELSPSNESIH